MREAQPKIDAAVQDAMAALAVVMPGVPMPNPAPMPSPLSTCT